MKGLQLKSEPYLICSPADDEIWLPQIHRPKFVARAFAPIALVRAKLMAFYKRSFSQVKCIVHFFISNGLWATSPRNVIYLATFRAESSSVSNNIIFPDISKVFSQMLNCFLLTRLNALMFMQIASLRLL